MNKRLGMFFIAVAVSALWMALLVFLYWFIKDPNMQRFLILAGGSLPYGVIQGITYLLFLFGLMDLGSLNKWVKKEEAVLKKGLLPEKDNWVISPADVMQLKLNVQEQLKNETSLIKTLIIQACIKYRSNKSTSETLEVVAANARISLANSESEQSLIRYVASAIPSIGFIGTIIGIAASLGFADQASSPEGIKTITSMLNVAFDTTLVALVLNLILLFYYHSLQKRVEQFHAKAETYVIENLVNRIYNT
jgi:chemotaxis protein MotA